MTHKMKRSGINKILIPHQIEYITYTILTDLPKFEEAGEFLHEIWFETIL